MIDFWGGLNIDQFDKKMLDDKNGQSHNWFKSFLKDNIYQFNFEPNNKLFNTKLQKEG